MAEAAGIDLSLVAGTGPGGRVVAEDVRLAAPSGGAARSGGATAAGDGDGGASGAAAGRGGRRR